MLTKIEFEKKYLYNSSDDILFNQIKNILSTKELNTNKMLINKQRRIEKLVNVYLLKKDELKYELNPL